MIEIKEKNAESETSSPTVGDLSDTSREDSFASVETSVDLDETYTPSFQDEESLESEEDMLLRTLPKRHR